MAKGSESNPTMPGKLTLAAPGIDAHAYVAIDRRQAQKLVHKLSEARLLIGRGSEAGLKLDSEHVSRSTPCSRGSTMNITCPT